MKKIYIALTVLAAVTLVSCEREKSFDELTPLGENDIAFVLKGVSTRSAVVDAPTAVQGVTIPMGTDNEGNALFLEETIEELNPSPATKGAPAYTVNVGTLYTTMGVYADGDFGEATFDVMDMYDHKGNPSDPKAPTAANPDANVGDGWRYHHNYSSNPWPDESSPVDFYFNMPAAPAGVSFSSRADKKIQFTYNMSEIATAVAQQDLLFSQASYSKSDHDGYLPNGAPVLMYHALSGVKFRSGSDNKGATKTIITKVVFKGLQDYGKCDIDLAQTNPANQVKWSDQDVKIGTFSQEFKNQAWSADANVDGTVNYGEYVEGTSAFGQSWYKAAGDKNLNNAEATQTFWFIPQTISEDVTLEVTFRVKTADTQDGTEITHTIDFGKLVNNAEWKAGQLRTYTLNPKDVDVEIFDTMSGYKKSNLHVTNTGNVDEYVRMMVIGNWYGWLPDQDPSKDEASILVGYETETGSEMVTAWYREDTTFSTGFDVGEETNTFEGGKPSGDNPWIQGTGSYFYYPDVIGAGEVLPSGTDALFQNYTLSQEWIPVIWIPSADGGRKQAQGVHLVMECVIQAIGAGKPDGSGNYATCWEAWSAATGETIEAKN